MGTCIHCTGTACLLAQIWSFTQTPPPCSRCDHEQIRQAQNTIQIIPNVTQIPRCLGYWSGSFFCLSACTHNLHAMLTMLMRFPGKTNWIPWTYLCVQYMHERCALNPQKLKLAACLFVPSLKIQAPPRITLQRAGMLSPVGRCKTLDASADGYVRAEAVGSLLLADLHGMEAPAQPQILAMLAGSAVNQV